MKAILSRRIISIVILLYVVGSTLFLAFKTLPDVRSGMVYLQLGEQRILTNPKEASHQFAQSAAAFEDASAELQSSPFLIKALTPLPPFRWYISLLKASHSLSDSGQYASSLSASFPSLLPEQEVTFNALLETATSRYMQWYSQQDKAFATLDTSLSQASSYLDAIPAWIAFGNRTELEALRKEVKRLSLHIHQTRLLSGFTLASFGSNDSASHTWNIVFTDSGTTISTGELRAKGGHITEFSLGVMPKDSAEGTITLDSSFIRTVIKNTGDLHLSENNRDITPKDFGSDEVTVPVLAELLPSIFANLGKNTSEPLIPLLHTALQNGSLRINPKNTEFQHALAF